MPQVSFKASQVDFNLIDRIIDRAATFAKSESVPFDRQGAVMDVTAVHVNGCPLRLADLLAAEDFDFVHDVFGIFRHIDRNTGRLLHCFVPRTAEGR